MGRITNPSVVLFTCCIVLQNLDVTFAPKPPVTKNKAGAVVSPGADAIPHLDICNSAEKTVSIVGPRNAVIQSPGFGTEENYKPKLKCSVLITGDSSCQVRAICKKVDLRPDCKNEFLTIFSGAEDFRTSAKLCGTNLLRDPYLSDLEIEAGENNGLRFDLKTSKDKEFKKVYHGFMCKASCVEDGELVEEEELEEPTTTTQKTTCPPTMAAIPVVEACADGQKMKNISIVEQGRLNIQSVNYGTDQSYPKGQKCSIFVHGNEKCQVQVVCNKVDMRAKLCKKEYIKILNGFEEYRTPVQACGSNLIRDPWKSDLELGEGLPNGLLFQLTTAKDAKFGRTYKGFQCNFRCADLEDFDCEEVAEPTPPPTPKPTCPPKVSQETPVIEVCGKEKKQNISIVEHKRLIVQSTKYGTDESYPTGQSCSVYVHGDANCQVQAVCTKVDLRPNLCKKESVQILNGYEDYRTPTKLCGSNLLRDPWVAETDTEPGVPNGLMIKVTTAKDAKFKRIFKGFHCDLRCSNLEEFDCDDVEDAAPTAIPTPTTVATTTPTTTTTATTTTTTTTTPKPTTTTTTTTTTPKPTTTTPAGPKYLPRICDERHEIASGPITYHIQTLNYGMKEQYPEGICLWRFKVKDGDKCVPQFRCTAAADIKANCTQEFIYWSEQLDGKNGIKICGGEFRDFAIYSKTKYFIAIVRTEGPYNRLYNGFMCNVRCTARKDAQSIKLSRNYFRKDMGPNGTISYKTEEEKSKHHDYDFHDFPTGVLPVVPESSYIIHPYPRYHHHHNHHRHHYLRRLFRETIGFLTILADYDYDY